MLKYGDVSPSGRLAIEFVQSFLYKDGSKSADIRLFGGSFFYAPGNNPNEQRTYFQAGGVGGKFDYLYDYTMMGRSEIDQHETFLARQII